MSTHLRVLHRGLLTVPVLRNRRANERRSAVRHARGRCGMACAQRAPT